MYCFPVAHLIYISRKDRLYFRVDWIWNGVRQHVHFRVPPFLCAKVYRNQLPYLGARVNYEVVGTLVYILVVILPPS